MSDDSEALLSWNNDDREETRNAVFVSSTAGFESSPPKIRGWRGRISDRPVFDRDRSAGISGLSMFRDRTTTHRRASVRFLFDDAGQSQFSAPSARSPARHQ